MILCAAGITGGVVLGRAQAPGQTAPRATESARAALQAATNDLDMALLRGDATSALKLLAPDFELGRHQYRRRDLAWMRQFLPRELEQAHFTKLSVPISTVELTGRRRVAVGDIQAEVSPKQGRPGANISGVYRATWIQTGAGWRIENNDEVFNLLLQLNVPVKPPAAIKLTDFPIDKATPLSENPSLVLEQSHQGKVEPLAYSPDGKSLATNDTYDGLRLASARTGAFLKAVQIPMFINSMTYAPDGTLVTGHSDGIVRLWDVKTGMLKRQFTVSKWGVYAVCVSPDGRTLAADGAGNVQLWDVATGHKLQTFGYTGGNVHTLAFSPDGAMLASETQDKVELWSVKEGKLKQTIQYVRWGGFLPDGKTIITLTDSTLRFQAIRSKGGAHEVAIPNPLRKPHEVSNTPLSGSEMVYFPGVNIAPNGKIAASIYEDGSIGLWDIRTGALLHRLRGFQSQINVAGGDVSTLAFSPDSASLAVGSGNGEVAIWKWPVVLQ